MAIHELPQLEDLVAETAAEHVTSQVPVAAPSDVVGDVRRRLAGAAYRTAAQVAVCEDERLVGVVRMEDLLAAAEETPIRQVMDADPPVVHPGEDQEVVAWRAVQHGMSALAVVDEGSRFVGFIPPSRLLAVLLWEHEEDMSRLGGFVRGAAAARSASEESVAQRFWHRIPWLLLGLLGAFAATQIVASFESQLERNVALAFFVPGIVYLAAAVGTQTEALAIRGLSVGVGIGRVVWREAVTGACVGVVLASAFFPLGLWLWGDGEVAVAVSLSLFAACSMATVVALALPWLFHRLGSDPAFGSGPLGTLAQDLLSLVIYFSIALALVD